MVLVPSPSVQRVKGMARLKQKAPTNTRAMPVRWAELAASVVRRTATS